MAFSFYKYHAAGNDFLLIDTHKETFPVDSDTICNLCTRRFGVGADGIILFSYSSPNELTMCIYNADGEEASMCGNALRILAKHHFSETTSNNNLTINTKVGSYAVIQKGSSIWIHMLTPKLLDTPNIELNNRVFQAPLIDSGVRHLLIPYEDIHEQDLNCIAAPLRKQYNANVSLFEDRGAQIKIRTYERGVEAETMACGTGALALFHYLGSAKATIMYPGGKMDFYKENGIIWMKAIAKYVFSGNIKLGFIE